MKLKLNDINEQDLLKARFNYKKYKNYEKRKTLYCGKMGDKLIPLIFATIIIDLGDNSVRINVIDDTGKEYIPFYNTSYCNKNIVADEVKEKYAKEVEYLIKDGICSLEEDDKAVDIKTLKEIITWEINGFSFKAEDTISIKGTINGNCFRENVQLQEINKSKQIVAFKHKGIIKIMKFDCIERLSKIS